MADQRRVKHQRLSGPEASKPPRNYDFLAPWCDALRGHLKATDEQVEFSNYGENSNAKQSQEEIQDGSPLKREALALLLLVFRVDKPAWQNILEQKCRVTYEDPDGDSDDDDEDDDEGSMGEISEGFNEIYGDEAIEDLLNDENLAHCMRSFNCPRDRRFIPDTFRPGTCFSRLSVDRRGSSVSRWLVLLGFQHSAEYVKAKNRILEMQSDTFKRHPWVGRTVVIPILLDLEFDGSNNDFILQQLVEVRQLLESVKRNADELDAASGKVEHFEDCAASYTVRLEGLSISMDDVPVSDLKASGVMEVLGAAICPGVPRTATASSSRCAKVSLTMRVPDARKLVSVLLLVRESGVHLQYLELEIGYCSREGKSATETREGFAQLIGKALTHPNNEHPPSSIETLSINCFDAESWQVEALFSAFGASQISVGNIYLSGGNWIKDAIRLRYWSMLGDALLHVPSCKCGFSCKGIHSFEAPNLQVGGADLRAITSVLRVKEAQAQGSTSHYVLRQGTQIRFTDGGGHLAGTPISLPDQLLVRLVEHEKNRNSGSEVANVIVPGYGKCQVFRQSLLADNESISIPLGSHLQCTPLTSLVLCVRPDRPGVAHFFKHVGWSLRSLSLKFSWDLSAADMNALLLSILRACPLLSRVTLRASIIDLDQFTTAYEQLGDSIGTKGPMLTTLKFCHLGDFGDGNGLLLAQQLGDPATRLGQHLKELIISTDSWERPFDSQMLAVLWMSLSRNSKLEKLKLVVSERNFTDQWARRFREFNGQVLSPHPLQQSSKLALLSVVCRQTTASDSAVQRVDERALSVIFEFAATRVTRCVQVSMVD